MTCDGGLLSPADVDLHAEAVAAYVHIPFCSAVCPYCDFAVVAGADEQIGRYIDGVLAEIEMSPRWRQLDSVYFGGGTPSHVDPAHLRRILDTLASHHGLADGSEISVEANPEDFGPDRASELIAAGFNRVSFGAQSFDGAVLARLGRRHRARDIEASLASARTAGFENVSMDLIFGTPVESDESWVATLRKAVALEPDHVSCYALTVEPGTPLHREVKAGAAAPDPDTQADRYETAEQVLGEAGLGRYEVSNWSRPGHESRYNLTVWAQGEYEAYGNGAHRFVDGVRSHNVRRLDAYLGRIERGERPISGSEPVRGWDGEVDRLFVGLRRSAGVGPGPGVDALLGSRGGDLLRHAGVIDVREGRLVVTRPLLTDEVHRQVLDLRPPQGWVDAPERDNL
ncbi:MAG TPA: radical SAM family heme chaperone HemW [Acidimicrobiia bacterium]|nr:radical SAM family heme chaperone HemW [Acidimicrobiia bacterium]